MNKAGKRETKPPAEPEQISGSEALRRLLQARASRPGVLLANIARDVNDQLATEANRKIAREIAIRMSGPDADETVIRDLVRSTMNTLPSKPVGPSTSESQLRSFMEGKDLAPEIKTALARYFYTGPVVYDEKRDLLDYPENAPVPPFMTNISGPWINPDPAIAEAQRIYREAILAAQPPQPVRTAPAPQPTILRRPGFA